MKMQTAELIGDPLDWAVAKALGPTGEEWNWLKNRQLGYEVSFSRLWERGGWLLEQCIADGMLVERVDPQYKNLQKFKATLDRWESVYRADTVLVAVCRCLIAHKLGLEVDIPQEVLAMPQSA
ncbi:hypothetical protein [Burkholderia ubonensis]|nr:hypothetical protein [Burkholderia ubonensis]KVP65605.1 hypothetical protein WJ93_24095 [Burkholderia ubonensis]